MAGSKPRASNPLLSGFILVGRRLEQLGFIYHKGVVMIIDPLEVQ